MDTGTLLPGELTTTADRLERCAARLEVTALQVRVATATTWRGEAATLHRERVAEHADDIAALAERVRRAAQRVRTLQHVAEQRLDLVGAVAPERMPEELARMDLAVAPYPQLPDFYFSPLKLYEYLAAGLPVVASDIGPCPDILDDGGLGVLVRPGDPAELAAALAGLRRDPTMRAELGRSGRRAAEDRHDWSLVVTRILDTAPTPRTSLADDLWGRTA